jgi:hypothetical protein
MNYILMTDFGPIWFHPSFPPYRLFGLPSRNIMGVVGVSGYAGGR